jgi:segregation and condensation protein B
MLDPRIKMAIEAAVFASEEPLNVKDLHTVLMEIGYTTYQAEELDEILAEMADASRNESQGFVLMKTGGGYQYLSHPDAEEVVSALLQHRSKKKLSRSMMETLSIIAYKQPVTKPEIDHIRGVSSDYAVHKLLERDLITIKGKADSPGKPLLYTTSAFFMDYFGINSIKDLPKLKEIRSEVNEIGMLGAELEEEMRDDESIQSNALSQKTTPLEEATPTQEEE